MWRPGVCHLPLSSNATIAMKMYSIFRYVHWSMGPKDPENNGVDTKLFDAVGHQNTLKQNRQLVNNLNHAF